MFFADEEDRGDCLSILNGSAAQSIFDGDDDEIEICHEWLEENTLHEWDEGEFQLFLPWILKRAKAVLMSGTIVKIYS